MNREVENNDLKICIIGHFGGKKIFTDGQTVKTKEIKKYLDKHGFSTKIVDTYFAKRNLLGFFVKIFLATRMNDAIILVVSSRGYKILSPILIWFNKKNKKKIFDFVIGGSRFKIFDEDKKLKTTAKKFTRIYVETDRILEEYKKRGLYNVKVLPNFKDLKFYEKDSFNINKQFKLCIFGRVEEEKGILDAIEAIRIANSDSDDIDYYLDIYGGIGKKFKETFEKVLNSNKKFVSYKGIAIPSEVPKMINKYDTLLFPTYWRNEGFPGVLIDAFFAATPVIATDWNDNFEILEEGVNGIKVNIKSPSEISKVLKRLAHDEKLLRHMSLENMKKSNKYTPEKVMKLFTDDLEKSMNNNKKNILFYIDSMHRGGAERVMSILVNRFAGDGHKIILVTDIAINSEKGDYRIAKRVKCICLKQTSKNPILKNLYKIRQLRKIIKKENMDVVLSFLGRQNYRMLIATWGLKCRKCISVRNDPNREYGNTMFKKWIANRIIGLADVSVFQTNDAKKYFNKKIQNKSEIIMNPIDDKFFEVKRVKYPKNIITIGRLEPQKNQKLLIDAFAMVADKVEGDNLLIYGEGSLRDELQKHIKEVGMEERIFLKGESDNIEKELAKAKAFVLSSDYEGMPNALMEAMAVGLPCAATDCPCGGSRELILGTKNGILVGCNSISELGEAIVSIVSNQKKINTEKNVLDNRKMSRILSLWLRVIVTGVGGGKK